MTIKEMRMFNILAVAICLLAGGFAFWAYHVTGHKLNLFTGTIDLVLAGINIWTYIRNRRLYGN